MLTNSCADDCPLKGKWKSNLKLTINEIEKNNKLSQKQLDSISKNFGKLEVEFTCNEFISYYEGTINKKSYKIIKKNGHFITIRHFDEILGQDSDNTLELVGDCYYVPYRTLKFKEAMCRVKE